MVEKVTSIYVTDVELWERFKRLSPRPVSQEIMDFVRRRVAELEGTENDSAREVDYEELKREYLKVCGEAEKLKKHLRRVKAYEKLIDLAEGLGIDGDASNYKEVSAGVLRLWDGSPEHAHIFTILLECLHRKRKMEHQLEAKSGISHKAGTNSAE